MAEPELHAEHARTAKAAWTLLCALVAFSPHAAAETKGTCARCGKHVKISDGGSGFDLKWEGLCPPCLDPLRRGDEMAKELRRRIDGLRAEIGFWKRLKGLPDDDAAAAESLVAEMEARLERLERRLEAGSPGDGGLAEAIEVARDLRQQVARSSAGTERLAEKVAAIPGRTGGRVRLVLLPVEAAALDDAEVARLLLAATTEPAEGAGDEPAEPGGASGDGIVPVPLKDVRRDALPHVPVSQEIELSRRHSANAAACADAMLLSARRFEAAMDEGDPERARKHLERAACLAAHGQREARKAAAMRADGARALWRGCESFEKHAKKEGKATEQVLADWLEGVRRNGLPREYVREYQASGFDDAHMAKRRAFLEGVDPKEAAEALRSFSRLVAPLLVADARGEAKAPAPPPEEDDLWDLAAILLLRSAPAEGGGR